MKFNFFSIYYFCLFQTKLKISRIIMRPGLFCKISKLFSWYFLPSWNYLKVFAIHRTRLILLWYLLERIYSTFFIIVRSSLSKISYVIHIGNLNDFTLYKVYFTQKWVIKYCFFIFILIHLVYKEGLVSVDCDTKGWHFKDTACYIAISILALVKLVFWQHEIL